MNLNVWYSPGETGKVSLCSSEAVVRLSTEGCFLMGEEVVGEIPQLEFCC